MKNINRAVRNALQLVYERFEFDQRFSNIERVFMNNMEMPPKMYMHIDDKKTFMSASVGTALEYEPVMYKLMHEHRMTTLLFLAEVAKQLGIATKKSPMSFHPMYFHRTGDKGIIDPIFDNPFADYCESKYNKMFMSILHRFEKMLPEYKEKQLKHGKSIIKEVTKLYEEIIGHDEKMKYFKKLDRDGIQLTGV